MEHPDVERRHRIGAIPRRPQAQGLPGVTEVHRDLAAPLGRRRSGSDKEPFADRAQEVVGTEVAQIPDDPVVREDLHLILRKRDGYRRAFDGFDRERVASFTDAHIDRLLGDASIVRNRAKITSTVDNARAVLAAQEEFGSFDRYVWSFVDGQPIVSHHARLDELPAKTDVSIAMSKDMKRRGFRFVGPTTVYAFMQAAGLADDHVVSCFRRQP